PIAVALRIAFARGHKVVQPSKPLPCGGYISLRTDQRQPDFISVPAINWPSAGHDAARLKPCPACAEHEFGFTQAFDLDLHRDLAAALLQELRSSETRPQGSNH